LKRIAILLSLCLVFCAQAYCQDTVKLQYKFTPGELLRYKIVFDANLQLDAPSTGKSLTIPIRMSAVYRQRTKRILPDGNAELNVAFESMRMQLGNEARDLPVKQIPVVTMVMAKTGQIQSAGATVNGIMANQMLGANGFGQSLLPDAELMVGDSWTQQIPEIPGVGKFQTRGTLVSSNMKLGKYSVAAIKESIGGNLNLDSALAQSFQGTSAQLPPGMKMDGAFLGDGTVYFSAERGQLIRTDGQVDVQVNVNIPEIQGQPVGNAAATMHMTYEMFLLSAGK
jgi:hypothetical protein